jgi:hypothetical protein
MPTETHIIEFVGRARIGEGVAEVQRGYAAITQAAQRAAAATQAGAQQGVRSLTLLGPTAARSAGEIRAAAGGAGRSLGEMGTAGERAGAQAARGMEQAGAAAERLSQKAASGFDRLEAAGTRMQTWGAGLSLTVTAPLVALGVKAGEGASAVNEALNKTRVVFGQSADSVIQWSTTTGDAFGQSQREALAAAGSFGNFFTLVGKSGAEAATMSRNLVELASDLASFHDAKPEEAVYALGAALRGESEPIRRFGVLLDEATLKNEALRMGLISSTKGSLEPAVRVQAAYGVIMRQTAVAQGDFARTANEGANMQRRANAQTEDAINQLGNHLLPLMKQGAEFVGSMAKAFNGLSPEMQKALVYGAGFAAILGPLLGVLGTAARGVVALRGAWVALTGIRAATTGAIAAHSAALATNSRAADLNTAALARNNGVAGGRGAGVHHGIPGAGVPGGGATGGRWGGVLRGARILGGAALVYGAEQGIQQTLEGADSWQDLPRSAANVIADSGAGAAFGVTGEMGRAAGLNNQEAGAGVAAGLGNLTGAADGIGAGLRGLGGSQRAFGAGGFTLEERRRIAARGAANPANRLGYVWRPSGAARTLTAAERAAQNPGGPAFSATPWQGGMTITQRMALMDRPRRGASVQTVRPLWQEAARGPEGGAMLSPDELYRQTLARPATPARHVTAGMNLSGAARAALRSGGITGPIHGTGGPGGLLAGPGGPLGEGAGPRGDRTENLLREIRDAVREGGLGDGVTVPVTVNTAREDVIAQRVIEAVRRALGGF